MRKFSSFLHFIKRIAVCAMVVSSPCTVFAQVNNGTDSVDVVVKRESGSVLKTGDKLCPSEAYSFVVRSTNPVDGEKYVITATNLYSDSEVYSKTVFSDMTATFTGMKSATDRANDRWKFVISSATTGNVLATKTIPVPISEIPAIKISQEGGYWVGDTVEFCVNYYQLAQANNGRNLQNVRYNGVELTAHVSGDASDCKFTWFKDGKTIEGAQTINASVLATANENAYKHDALYGVAVVNQYGCQNTMSVNVRAHDAPRPFSSWTETPGHNGHQVLFYNACKNSETTVNVYEEQRNVRVSRVSLPNYMYKAYDLNAKEYSLKDYDKYGYELNLSTVPSFESSNWSVYRTNGMGTLKNENGVVVVDSVSQYVLRSQFSFPIGEEPEYRYVVAVTDQMGCTGYQTINYNPHDYVDLDKFYFKLAVNQGGSEITDVMSDFKTAGSLDTLGNDTIAYVCPGDLLVFSFADLTTYDAVNYKKNNPWNYNDNYRVGVEFANVANVISPWTTANTLTDPYSFSTGRTISGPQRMRFIIYRNSDGHGQCPIYSNWFWVAIKGNTPQLSVNGDNACRLDQNGNEDGVIKLRAVSSAPAGVKHNYTWWNGENTIQLVDGKDGVTISGEYGEVLTYKTDFRKEDFGTGFNKSINFMLRDHVEGGCPSTQVRVARYVYNNPEFSISLDTDYVCIGDTVNFRVTQDYSQTRSGWHYYSVGKTLASGYDCSMYNDATNRSSCGSPATFPHYFDKLYRVTKPNDSIFVTAYWNTGSALTFDALEGEPKNLYCYTQHAYPVHGLSVPAPSVRLLATEKNTNFDEGEVMMYAASGRDSVGERYSVEGDMYYRMFANENPDNLPGYTNANITYYVRDIDANGAYEKAVGKSDEYVVDTIARLANKDYYQMYAESEYGCVSEPFSFRMPFGSAGIQLDTFKLSAIAINGNVEGVGLYTFGSTAELVAIPDSGYLFDHWSNGETTASIKVDVKSDSTFTAYFYKNAVWGSGKSDIDLHAFRMDGTELMPGENICPDEVYSFEVKYLNNGEKCKVVVKSLDDENQTLSEDIVADGKKEALFFLKPVGRKADNWRIFVVKDGLTLTSVDATVSYEAIPSIGIKAFANDRELMADSLNTVDLCEYEPLLLKTVASNPDSINIWRWTNRDTGRVYVPQLKVEPLQSFRVEATTIGGCKAKADINVRLNKQPALFITGVSNVCVGSDFQLQVNGADSYLWLDYDSLSTDVVKAHADSAGYKVFVVEGVSKEGCRSMVEYAVEYVAVPNFRINTEGANVCEGGVAYLSVDAEQQDYAYEWFGGTSVFDKRAITVPCDSAGSYGYVVRVTDKNGCQSSDSAVVRVYNNPRLFVANDGYDVVCEGYDVVLNGASDFADEMYWTTASGDSVPGAFYGGLSFASQTYTLHGLKHYENNVTCSSVADFTVKVQPNPTFEVVGNLSVCPGDSVILEAVSKKDEKLQFFWPNQEVKGAVLTDLIRGKEDEYTSKKYFVEATSDFGCRAFTEVEVTSLPINKITIETDPDVVYVGESVSLVAYSENAVSYNWGNDGVGSVIKTVVEEEREFNVEVTDANGCKSRASYVVKPRFQNTRYWDIYTYVEGEGEVLGGGSYAEGNDAVLIAIPAKGYHFVRWNNGVTSDTLIMVVRNDEKISALFAIDSFKLETVAENGKIFGAGVYVYGWEVILKAMPDSGYIFDKWSTGEKEQEIVVRVVSDTTITAYFYKLDEFKVDAMAENGTVKGTGYYKIGDRVNLYAVPDSGYHFLYWGDRTTVDSLSFTVTGDTLFFAYFGKDSVAGPAEEKIPVDVLVRYPIGQGAIDGAGTYSKGDTIVLIAKPEYGYHFDKWSNGSTDDTLLAVVVVDTTFEAYFAPDTFKVEGIAEMGGKVIGGGQFTYRDTVYMVAIPDTGYVFGGWSNGSISDTIAVITEKDQSITAYFHKEGDVKVNVIADNGSAGGIGYYPVGDSIALVAKADTGYHFVRWENGSTDDTLYISVKNDTVIKAYFEPDTFMVTLKMEGFGLLLGEGEYAYGDTAKLVAAPIEGYIFSKWSTGDTTNLLNHVVTGDTTITAYFMKALGDIKVDVIAENGSAGGVGMYSKGDTVVLVAKPDTNYHFTHWGNGWTKDTLYLSVKSDTVIYAYFAIDSFKVESGCVNGGIAGVGVYPYGTTVALLAMPDSNYIFERWENGDTTATTRIVVTNDTVVTAYFYHKNSVYVDVLAEHGTVNGAGHYMVGDTISLSVQADWGYKFIGWDNGSTSDTLQLVVAGDSMVTALFRLDSFSIKAYCNNGAVLIAGPMTYVYGDTATLSVKPNEGYVLYNWSTGDTTSEIKVAILSDTVVVAYCYKEGFYPVSAVATNGIVGGVGDYPVDSVAHLVATPVDGYHFVKWMHGDTAASIDTTVKSPIALEAIFEQDTFKVELEVVGNGTVSGEGYYAYGEVASIKAMATDSSIFVRWSDGSTEAEREIKMKSDTVLTASFRDKQRVVISPEIDTTYGTIEGAGEYLEGDTIVLVIKPIDNDSVKFVGWSDGDTSTHKTVVVGVDDDVYPVFEKVNSDNTVIPNAFTPVTKDGINDHFMKGYEVRIFNRYQQLVHEGNDGWDGMYRGEFAEAGTYFYVVTMKDGRVHRGPVELVVFK